MEEKINKSGRETEEIWKSRWINPKKEERKVTNRPKYQ